MLMNQGLKKELMSCLELALRKPIGPLFLGGRRTGLPKELSPCAGVDILKHSQLCLRRASKSVTFILSSPPLSLWFSKSCVLGPPWPEDSHGSHHVPDSAGTAGAGVGSGDP